MEPRGLLLPACPQERCALLRRLGPVFRPRLLAVVYTAGIQGTAYDVVTNAGQVFHPTSAHQHHGVFLKIMPFTGDVSRDLHTVGQANPGDLAQRRIGLLRRHGLDLGAYTALLWGMCSRTKTSRVTPERIAGEPQRRRLGLFLDALAALTNQLIDRRHDDS